MNSYPDAGNLNEMDRIDTTSVFSGFKRIIQSKNFKGGDVANMFGGTELDFTYADIKTVAIIDVSQLFGELKLTIPEGWYIEKNILHFLSVVKDYRRDIPPNANTNKVLVLKGFSLMASVEIHSANTPAK